MTPKQEFIEKLNPLLIASEKAINAGDADGARLLARQTVLLIGEYVEKMPLKDIRDALNNPVAGEIAKRLGVQI